MDNQRTPSHGPHRGPQSLDRAEQQRGYRGRERDAFRTLVAALKEVELTNPRSRRDILRRAAECLRRLGKEQVNLQQQLTDNIVGPSTPQPEAQEYLSDDDLQLLQFCLAIPQPEAQEYLSDEDLRLLQFFLAQSEYPDDRVGTGEPSMDVGLGGAYSYL